MIFYRKKEEAALDTSFFFADFYSRNVLGVTARQELCGVQER
jgi:hypothetical protein